MAIAIGGFMATGKTTIGRALANYLGWPFHDLDDVVNAHCLRRYGSPISDLIVQGNERLFRESEYHCVVNWMATLSDSSIVALGGGTLHNNFLGAHIELNHKLIVLQAKWNFIKERIVNSQRPLRHSAEQLFLERREGYQCGILFHVDKKEVSVCVQELSQLIRSDVHVK